MKWDNAEKNAIRTVICAKTNPKRYNHVLLLPSDTALDVSSLLASGAITDLTAITAVERDPKKAKALEKTLKGLGLHFFQIIRKDLVDVDLIKVVGKGARFDFVYLDTCSFLSEKMLNWLIGLKENDYKLFVSGCKFYTTFCHFNRTAHKFMSQFLSFAGKDHNPAYHYMALKSPRAVKTVEELGKFNKESEFRVKSLKTLNNMMRCIFNAPTRTFQYKVNSMVMTVFEHEIDHKKNPNIAFLRRFLESIKTVEKVKTPKVKVVKPKTYLETRKVKPGTLEVKYKQSLAGWKAAGRRIKLTDHQIKSNLVIKTFEFVQGLSTKEQEKVAKIFHEHIQAPLKHKVK